MQCPRRPSGSSSLLYVITPRRPGGDARPKERLSPPSALSNGSGKHLALKRAVLTIWDALVRFLNVPSFQGIRIKTHASIANQ
jgi:hypothetical protein